MSRENFKQNYIYLLLIIDTNFNLKKRLIAVDLGQHQSSAVMSLVPK